MSTADYTSLVNSQRAYFKAGKTRPVSWRVEQLKAIKAMVEASRGAIREALWHDLRRNATDADLMDIDINVHEAEFALAHLHDWIKPRREATPIVLEPGHVRVRRSVASAAVVAEMIPKFLDPDAVSVVTGGVPETTALLDQQWDLIFFTGSPTVGKIIHQAAAKHLTPTVLELGGKNPTIVHSSANLKVAARRIAYGRFSNSGHICTAPDHVLVWPEVKDEFVAHLTEAIRDFYGDDPKASPDYGRIINRRTFDHLAGLISNGTVAVGGDTDLDELYIAPTVLVDVRLDSQIMREEVFGPILPVLEIDSVERVIDWVNERPAPLGLYIFSEDASVVQAILERTSSGDACVNDCAVHPLVQQLPFGGVGNSGMGKYHGRWGFEAFTNARGVLYHSPLIDPGVKYPPYSAHKLERKIVKKLM